MINTHLAQPTEALHSLFPHKQAGKKDPFRAETEYVVSKFSLAPMTLLSLLLEGPTVLVIY